MVGRGGRVLNRERRDSSPRGRCPDDRNGRIGGAASSVGAAAALAACWLCLSPAHAARPLEYRAAIASAYSAESSGALNGCDGSRLHDGDLTFAALIVPCGARVRFCIGRRCVDAVRRDSGPYVAGRAFDLNLGIVRALGFRSCAAFGVRRVAWRRL